MIPSAPITIGTVSVRISHILNSSIFKSSYLDDDDDDDDYDDYYYY